ncbi:MAG: hypothetical protein K0R61_5646 [Microvirga sp.]|nr:hypothetical protein [Microvirga sp.]
MEERPSGCPCCGGVVLVRSGHACGRQRWRCKGCGRQFTRTEPRGKPAALKRHAIELYCLGLLVSHGPTCPAHPLGAAARSPAPLRPAGTAVHRSRPRAAADRPLVCPALAGGGHVPRGA